jgi:hypothetical protein
VVSLAVELGLSTDEMSQLVFQNKVLERIAGTKREEVTQGQVHNHFHNFFSSLSIIIIMGGTQ